MSDKPAKKRTIYTVAQVAEILKVAPRTVSKWFDSGRLRGYRIPGSHDIRIPHDHLEKFVNEHLGRFEVRLDEYFMEPEPAGKRVRDWHGEQQRAVACAAALAGVEDPQKFVDLANAIASWVSLLSVLSSIRASDIPNYKSAAEAADYILASQPSPAASQRRGSR